MCRATSGSHPTVAARKGAAKPGRATARDAVPSQHPSGHNHSVKRRADFVASAGADDDDDDDADDGSDLHDDVSTKRVRGSEALV